MISVEQVSVFFGGFELFKNFSFLINPRDRIGLVGKNGAGKSTLLKLIKSIQAPSEGKITYPGDIQIGYLPQQMRHHDGKTVFDEAKTAFAEALNLDKEIAKINTEIAERTDYESESYSKLIHNLSEKSERLQLITGGNIDAEIEKTLIGLGFERTDFERSTSEFSGGWRMRIELAKILMQRPDALLLDEPTNHLDIESIQWLENFLKEYPGAVLLISHDRASLDNVTNRTLEISVGSLYDYKVNYSTFIELRKERREQQMNAYLNQQKMIGKTEEFIERFRYKATKSVQVQSRIKHLEKVERIEIDELDTDAINIKFPPAPRSGDIVFRAEGLSKAYGDHLVLSNIDLDIERGEKIAFVGRNGEGKTTLSRVIIDQLDATGDYKVGHNVNIGYFAQNQDELLDESKNVLETIDEIAVGDIRTKVRDLLGAFLFRGEDVEKKVKVLSGGERSRLALVKLLLNPYNLLVLDEPTNHLDMRSKDILKQALLDFEGTIILVSHDRDFLEGLVDKVYEFRNKKIKENIGGIYEFLAKKRLENLKDLELKKQEKAKEVKVDSDNKMAYQERKDLDKKIRKAKKLMEEAEQNIEKMEAELADYDEKMGTGEIDFQDKEFYTKYEQLKQDLEAEMMKWEELTEEYEEIKALK